MASPKGAPLPTGTDDPDVVGDLTAYAVHMDTRVPQAYYGTAVNVTATSAIAGAAAVTFPAGLFPGGPRVFCQSVGTTLWVAFPSAVGASGCTVTIRHIDLLSATATVAVNLYAFTN